MTAARHMTAIRPQVSSADPVNWIDMSACAQIGPGPWDDQATEGARQRGRREALAKSICAECPVIAACLAYAIARRERGGIWGGLTEAERDAGAPTPEPEPPALSCGDAQGSEAGLKRHNRLGEHGCPACLTGAAQAKLERDERRRGERIRARDYMRAQAATVRAMAAEPDWVATAHLNLLDLETRRASA